LKLVPRRHLIIFKWLSESFPIRTHEPQRCRFQGASSWNSFAGLTLVKNLRPCPVVLLDREQITNVVTNPILNASEAISQSGEIRIETSQNNGRAVLLVADNGCGMTPEFLSRALFRPFQTTKKKGLGIGMFQSKMIVEAHGGRIEVKSEVRKGAAFRVLLPMDEHIK
jgi:signal transduction histidine kinase